MSQVYNIRNVSQRQIYDSYMGILRISPNGDTQPFKDDINFSENIGKELKLSDSDGNELPITFKPVQHDSVLFVQTEVTGALYVSNLMELESVLTLGFDKKDSDKSSSLYFISDERGERNILLYPFQIPYEGQTSDEKIYVLGRCAGHYISGDNVKEALKDANSKQWFDFSKLYGNDSGDSEDHLMKENLTGDNTFKSISKLSWMEITEPLDARIESLGTQRYSSKKKYAKSLAEKLFGEDTQWKNKLPFYLQKTPPNQVCYNAIPTKRLKAFKKIKELDDNFIHNELLGDYDICDQLLSEQPIFIRGQNWKIKGKNKYLTTDGNYKDNIVQEEPTNRKAVSLEKDAVDKDEDAKANFIKTYGCFDSKDYLTKKYSHNYDIKNPVKTHYHNLFSSIDGQMSTPSDTETFTGLYETRFISNIYAYAPYKWMNHIPAWGRCWYGNVPLNDNVACSKESVTCADDADSDYNEPYFSLADGINARNNKNESFSIREYIQQFPLKRTDDGISRSRFWPDRPTQGYFINPTYTIGDYSLDNQHVRINCQQKKIMFYSEHYKNYSKPTQGGQFGGRQNCNIFAIESSGNRCVGNYTDMANDWINYAFSTKYDEENERRIWKNDTIWTFTPISNVGLLLFNSSLFNAEKRKLKSPKTGEVKTINNIKLKQNGMQGYDTQSVAGCTKSLLKNFETYAYYSMNDENPIYFKDWFNENEYKSTNIITPNDEDKKEHLKKLKRLAVKINESEAAIPISWRGNAIFTSIHAVQNRYYKSNFGKYFRENTGGYKMGYRNNSDSVSCNVLPLQYELDSIMDQDGSNPQEVKTIKTKQHVGYQGWNWRCISSVPYRKYKMLGYGNPSSETSEQKEWATKSVMFGDISDKTLDDEESDNKFNPLAIDIKSNPHPTYVNLTPLISK